MIATLALAIFLRIACYALFLFIYFPELARRPVTAFIILPLASLEFRSFSQFVTSFIQYCIPYVIVQLLGGLRSPSRPYTSHASPAVLSFAGTQSFVSPSVASASNVAAPFAVSLEEDTRVSSSALTSDDGQFAASTVREYQQRAEVL